jgi:hypothetical protein
VSARTGAHDDNRDMTEVGVAARTIGGLVSPRVLVFVRENDGTSRRRAPTRPDGNDRRAPTGLMRAKALQDRSAWRCFVRV